MDVLLILAGIIGGAGYIALLVFGFILTIRMSFRAGQYFFSIMLFLLLVNWSLSAFMPRWMEHLNRSEAGMTVGEFSLWVHYITEGLKLLAYVVLVYGLWRLWKEKQADS